MALPAPLAYWPFDQASGTTAADVSGNGHTATFVHGTWDTTTPKFGAAALANTAGGAGATFASINVGTVHSVACWINGWNESTSSVVIGGSSAAADQYALFLAAGPRRVFYSVGGGVYVSLTISSSLAGSHHLVVVRNGTAVTFYVDGALAGTVTLSSNGTLTLAAISGQADGNNPFTGTIDDVRVYDVALTGTQVAELFALNLAPASLSFVNFAHGNLGFGATATSLSTNAFVATAGNHIAVLIRANSATPYVTSVIDTAGNTYVKAGVATNDLEIWYAENILGHASNVVTASFSRAVNYIEVTAVQHSGLRTSGSFAAFSMNTSASGATTASCTPSVASLGASVCLAFADVYATGSYSSFSPTGFTWATPGFSTTWARRIDLARVFDGTVPIVATTGTTTGGNIAVVIFKAPTNAFITATGTFSAITDGTDILVECIGGGGAGLNGGGDLGTGGGGGGYAKKLVPYVSGTVIPVTVGAGGATSGANGGDSSWNSGVVIGRGGQGGQASTGGTGGGVATASVGTTVLNGGRGGGLGPDSRSGGGGGGAAGPAGSGHAGGEGGGSPGTPAPGGGGGGNGGGSGTPGIAAILNGGTGGAATDGTAGGAAGISGASPTDGAPGAHGSGGGGGGTSTAGTFGKAGGAGGVGQEWDSTHGSGGGGGGGGASSNTSAAGPGGAGGNYGGGGGGGAYSSPGVFGPGAPGIIKVTTNFGGVLPPPSTDFFLIDSAFTTSPSGGGTGTTPAIDTTGAVLLVVSVSQYAATSVATLSDSKGNVWVPLTYRTAGNAAHRFFYVAAPITGAGHTVSPAGSAIYCAATFWAFGGPAVASIGTENGTTTTSAGPLATGSVTPALDKSLIVSGWAGMNNTSNPTVDSGMTQTTRQNPVNNFCIAGGAAYKIQTPAAAINPTWSWTGTDGVAEAVAVFRPAAGIPSASVSVTQSVIEVITLPNPLALVTQTVAEVLSLTFPQQRVTQVGAEIIALDLAAPLRVTQVGTEVTALNPAAPVRVTQVGMEVIASYVPAGGIRVTQTVVETITPFVQTGGGVWFGGVGGTVWVE